MTTVGTFPPVIPLAIILVIGYRGSVLSSPERHFMSAGLLLSLDGACRANGFWVTVVSDSYTSRVCPGPLFRGTGSGGGAVTARWLCGGSGYTVDSLDWKHL
jgi:hypothetical protein